MEYYSKTARAAVSDERMESFSHRVDVLFIKTNKTESRVRNVEPDVRK